MASRLAGWQCMTMRLAGSTDRRAAWLIIWAGNSEVNFPPSVKPHSSWAFLPSSVMRMTPRLQAGSYCTFLKYLPVPVTMKYLPSRAGASKPVGMSRMTALTSRYSAAWASSSIQLMLPPLRSSQPWVYILVMVRTISTRNGAFMISFMVNSSYFMGIPASMGKNTDSHFIV